VKSLSRHAAGLDAGAALLIAESATDSSAPNLLRHLAVAIESDTFRRTRVARLADPFPITGAGPVGRHVMPV